MALKRLTNELKNINKDPNYYYSVHPDDNNFLKWIFIIIGPVDTIYEGGIFKGIINFPKNYPIEPPHIIFNNMIHPNVYSNGDVCISILHRGSDQYGYEKDFERWSPTHGVDSIMMSIISMLSDPNFESPANIAHSKLWREEPELYKQKIYKLVAESQK
jgi:ubiquitin-conjugating enzyme E2 G1